MLLSLTGCNDQIQSRSIDGNVMNGEAFNSPAPNPTPTPNPTPDPIPGPQALHKRCQSEQRCWYSKMPVYAQDSGELETYVGSMVHIPGYQDPGLCVPTSAAMLLRAVLDERNSQTVLNNSFLSGVQSKPWVQTVYKIGVDIGTDFVNGGAPVGGVDIKFREYFSKTKAKIGLIQVAEGTVGSRSTMSNAELIQAIRTRKFGFLIGVDFSLKKKNTKNVEWYEPINGGHALVIKGYDWDRLHLQDPWGMDYFVRVETENVAHTVHGMKEKTSVFKPVTSAGSMGSFGGTHKISLYELYGITLD